MENTWRWMHKVDSLGSVQMRIGVDQSPCQSPPRPVPSSHASCPESPTRKPSQACPKAENMRLQLTLKRIQRTCFFYKTVPPLPIFHLVLFPLGSDVVVRKLFALLIVSSLLKINPSILLLLTLPAENGECTLNLGIPAINSNFTSPSESSRLRF